MKLAAGVHVGVRGWLSANQTFLHSGSCLDIVDSGFCTHESQTLALVKHELNKQAGTKVGKLLNTHLHSDHCGGNHILQETFGCEIWIPQASWDIVKNWDEDKLSYKAMGQPCPRFKPDQKLIPDQKINLGGRDWLILAAPGHDHHSVMFYQESLGILISADALWENGFGTVFHELFGEGGFAEAKDTLDLIAGLDVSIVIPGHGAPFTNVKQALSNAYGRLDYLASDTKKNALHVAKVLLSFKLMELQTMSAQQCEIWFISTPMFSIIAKEIQVGVEQLFDMTRSALVASGIIQQQGETLVNMA